MLRHAFLWRCLTTSNCDSGVLHATGYTPEVLDIAWDKYREPLAAKLAALSKPIVLDDDMLAAYWYLMFVYIHHYPRWNKFISSVLNTPLTGPVSCQKFYTIVVPIMCMFSTVVDEIHWGERLHEMNHGSHFLKDRFTTIFDGTNINVQNIRKDKRLTRVMFNGSKYNHCCVKLMIGITFFGTIVHYTGPHMGTMNDEIILAKYPPAFLPFEWGMGDGAFESNYHIMVKYQQPPNGVLQTYQVYMNTIFNYWRLRVEHIMSEIKRHDMFDGVFRGSYVILKSAIDLTVHMTNIKLKSNLPRYRTCGPWPHSAHGCDEPPAQRPRHA